MAYAINRSIRSIPHLDCLLNENPRAIVGWGRKASGRQAQALAWLMRRPVLLLEDGFLRSVARAEPPRSLLIDDIGVYYDGGKPSRVEQTIAAGIDAAADHRARAIAQAWCAAGLSKYNHAPHYPDALPARYVLVADQCFGDHSVACGLASAASFAAMVKAALAENPDAAIIVKIHPDVAAGRRCGYIERAACRDPRVSFVGEDCHPLRLIAGAEAVYAVTSLIGFEALLHGKRVRCFGMPFYAGWGLTGDALARPARRHPAPLAALVHAAFVAVPRYADPVSGARWEPEEAIADAAKARAALLAKLAEAQAAGYRAAP